MTLARRAALLFAIAAAVHADGDDPAPFQPRSTGALERVTLDPVDLRGSPTSVHAAEEMSPGLRTTLDTLMGNSGPDGLVVGGAPGRPVRGQNARLGLARWSLAGTLPTWQSNDAVVLLNGSADGLLIGSQASILGVDAALPDQLWNFQGGGMYIRQFGDGRSWGIGGALGSASDRPFHSRRELVASTLGFLRTSTTDEDAWVFYAVSATNGQLGRNIPVPGVAYEFVRGPWSGVVGFPFVRLQYQDDRALGADFYYAALSDVEAHVIWRFSDQLRLRTGYSWTNQSWLRAGRSNGRDQLFLYEQRADALLGWKLNKSLRFELGGGFAFDRYFVETSGWNLSGPHRVSIAPGPFLAAQWIVEY